MIFHNSLSLSLSLSLSRARASIGIESVVNNGDKSSIGRNDAMCNACEMAVVWMQNQLKQNQTQELILNHINQVNILSLSCY